MYPQLDYIDNTQSRFSVDETLVNDVLKNSKGQKTMSDEDVKLAILSLLATCTTQQKLIDELIDCVNEMRKPKKRFWNH